MAHAAAAEVTFQPGDHGLLFYQGEMYGHERIFLCPSVPPEWWIVTPDENMYKEPYISPW